MKIVNAKVFNSKSKTFENKIVYTDKGLFSDKDTDGIELDAKGKYLIPGFIDMHLHAAVNFDFLDATNESLSKIAKYLAKNGVTSFTPASMTVEKEVLEKAFLCAGKFKSANDEAFLEGIYVEGPFISERKAGAQKKDCIKSPDIDFIKSLDKLSNGLVKTVVIAPETDGADTFITALKDSYNLSLGHSVCDYDCAKKAFSLGVSQLTHAFNAMNPINHRQPGPILAAYDNDSVFAELICDGTHIHDAVIRMMFSLFKDRIIMISDSMMATGLSDGMYSLGGQDVIVKDHVARLKDGTIAGSVSNLYDCFLHAVKKALIPIEDAIIACTKTPALKLSIYDKAGSIDIGKRADFIIADDALSIDCVCLRGNIVK